MGPIFSVHLGRFTLPYNRFALVLDYDGSEFTINLYGWSIFDREWYCLKTLYSNNKERQFGQDVDAWRREYYVEQIINHPVTSLLIDVLNIQVGA